MKNIPKCIPSRQNTYKLSITLFVLCWCAVACGNSVTEWTSKVAKTVIHTFIFCPQISQLSFRESMRVIKYVSLQQEHHHLTRPYNLSRKLNSIVLPFLNRRRQQTMLLAVKLVIYSHTHTHTHTLTLTQTFTLTQPPQHTHFSCQLRSSTSPMSVRKWMVHKTPLCFACMLEYKSGRPTESLPGQL